MVDQGGRWYPDYVGQQPYQDPAYVRMMSQQMQQRSQPDMVRSVEVIPVKNENAVQEFPVSAGTTKLMQAEDDSFVAIKAVSMTGQIAIDFYDKRPPAPAAPTFDTSTFITRDEFEERIAGLSKRAKKEAEA